MRTSNPVLNGSTLSGLHSDYHYESSNSMTVQGTAMNTIILLGLCSGAAGLVWGLASGSNPAMAGLLGMTGAIAGFVLCLMTTFQPRWAPATAPLYAIAEGLVLGGISAWYERQLHGIVFQALLGTFGTLFALLFAYQSGVIRPNQSFRMGVIAATGGIALMYLIGFILSLFHFRMDFLSMGPIGIAVHLGIVIVAAMNLVLDFDLIESLSQRGAPKYCEWYGAFSLMVTLVWLYIELLRLLLIIASYMQGSDDRSR